MTESKGGWGSEYDRDLSNMAETNEDFEFNEAGKPTKAIIGIGLLVALAIALAFFHPGNRDTASVPSSQTTADTARNNSVNTAPGQTTGSAGSAPPSSSAK